VHLCINGAAIRLVNESGHDVACAWRRQRHAAVDTSAKAGDYKARSERLGMYPVCGKLDEAAQALCLQEKHMRPWAADSWRHACIASAQEHKRIDSRGAMSVEEHLVYLPHDTSWQKEQRPLWHPN